MSGGIVNKQETLSGCYLVTRTREYPAEEVEGKSRQELFTFLKEKAQQLGGSIEKRFSAIELAETTMFGPLVYIPGDAEEVNQLIGEVQQAFACNVIDVNTPMQLIR
jgi:hypothetical protein